MVFYRLKLGVHGTLLAPYLLSKYMDIHKMESGGTDDAVNNMASQVTKIEHHPFIELPGDAEVGAFSAANFFAVNAWLKK